MKRQGSFIRKNVFEFDWNEFPDEALQYDAWNLNFDDEDDVALDPDNNNNTPSDDVDPNRYLQ